MRRRVVAGSPSSLPLVEWHTPLVEGTQLTVRFFTRVMATSQENRAKAPAVRAFVLHARRQPDSERDQTEH